MAAKNQRNKHKHKTATGFTKSLQTVNCSVVYKYVRKCTASSKLVIIAK